MLYQAAPSGNRNSATHERCPQPRSVDSAGKLRRRDNASTMLVPTIPPMLPLRRTIHIDGAIVGVFGCTDGRSLSSQSKSIPIVAATSLSIATRRGQPDDAIFSRTFSTIMALIRPHIDLGMLA